MTVRTPVEVVRAWVAAFNNRGLEALGAGYAPDAINHQVVEAPLEGRLAIMARFREEFARAEMTFPGRKGPRIGRGLPGEGGL